MRLDVYVNDGRGTVFDIEMQAVNFQYLSRRTRYYQSMIDLQLVDKGQDYDTLNNSFLMGKDLGPSDEEIITRLRMKFDLTEEQARVYLDEAE